MLRLADDAVRVCSTVDLVPADQSGAGSYLAVEHGDGRIRDVVRASRDPVSQRLGGRIDPQADKRDARCTGGLLERCAIVWPGEHAIGDNRVAGPERREGTSVHLLID